MAETSLAAELQGEHREIDRRLEAYASDPGPAAATGVREAVALLRRHIWVEEEHLFPALRDRGLLAPVLVMLREHGRIWERLDVLERELREDPRGAAYSCHLLCAELQHHNAKEERILYPEVDASVPDAERPAVSALVREVALPAGWVPAMSSR